MLAAAQRRIVPAARLQSYKAPIFGILKQIILRQLRFILKVAMTNRMSTYPCGVTGTTMVQHVASGWLAAGMKNGASGKTIGAGNIMEHGKWDIDLK
mgnify:CR=1 FL=1